MMPTMHPKFIIKMKQDLKTQSSQILNFKKRFTGNPKPSDMVLSHVFKKTKSKGDIITPKSTLALNPNNFLLPENSLENFSLNFNSELENVDFGSQTSINNPSKITEKDAPVAVLCQSEDIFETAELSNTDEDTDLPFNRQQVRTFNNITTASSAFTFYKFNESKLTNNKDSFQTFGIPKNIIRDQN